MKLVNTLLQLAVVGLLCLAPAFAQTSANIVVDVPFAFQVGDQKLPAGEYNMKAAGGSNLLLVRNDEGKAIVLALTTTNPTGNAPKVAQARFRVYGDAHFLAGIYVPGTDGRYLQKSHAEGKAAEGKSPIEVAVIAIPGR